MRADNTAHLIAAASRRHELARSKAIRAIRELDAAADLVAFFVAVAACTRPVGGPRSGSTVPRRR
jgi:hypothetical protein